MHTVLGFAAVFVAAILRTALCVYFDIKLKQQVVSDLSLFASCCVLYLFFHSW